MKTQSAPVSTSGTFAQMLVYFLLFLAGELLSSLPFDFLFSVVQPLPSPVYVICRMTASLMLTVFLFWFYTTKVLHRRMEDFGITFSLRRWGIWLSVLLPALVAGTFALIGTVRVNAVSAGQLCLILLSSAMIALKSGITEEMLFRGYLMKLVENRWGWGIAIFVPSLVFGLVHIPSMSTRTVGGVILLVLSGTLVGVLFSLAAYKGNSVSNSALMHAVWNFVMITGILSITSDPASGTDTLISILLPSNHLLLTGGEFGAEASLIAVLGYALTCALLFLPGKRKAPKQEGADTEEN